MKFYIAGSWRRKNEIKKIEKRLESVGDESTTHWLREQDGPHNTEDPSPERWAEFRAAAEDDLRGIRECDVFILVANDPNVPSIGGGRFVEMGYAIALGKQIIVLGDHETVFSYLPEINTTQTINGVMNIMANGPRWEKWDTMDWRDLYTRDSVNWVDADMEEFMP